MTSRPPAGVVASRLGKLADRAIAESLRANPTEATYFGGHAHDADLDDLSADAARGRSAQIRSMLAEPGPLAPDTVDALVDSAVLRTVRGAELFQLDDPREADWNPVLHSPGGALHADRQVHYAMLAYRSPRPRHLRTLLGLAAANG